ncbi:MAG TPA: Stp1/IreP family PP2C-type Ser/Thr phosphatase [Solirubrobacteraceae bacterium]|nr:Stp1/IreP family PP2C-type Ser/Thr phosphatase [Solirubrobacteraceae bacterium]
MLRATQVTCRTDTGRQRRGNEDSAFAHAPLFVVADGMGGAQAGEVASQMAVETFRQALPDGTSAEERLAQRIREANRRIHDRSRAERERAGMGTTLTAAYLDDGTLAIAHVGDSRAYLMRDGALKRLTRDHSLVGELVQRGKLTEEEAAEHPQRSIITRALGPEPDVEVDTWSYPVRAGDVILLCSDGLTSMVSEDEVAEILAGGKRLEDAAEGLIGAANAAGGRDNITVVLFRVEDDAGLGDATLEHAVIGAPAVDGDPDGTGAPPPLEPPPQPLEPPPADPYTSAPRRVGTAPGARRRRFAKPMAALISVIVVLCLVGTGGYLASRQLYFVGTDAQGVVTIYRGLPYDLPFGIHLYETYYVSGFPASLIPPDRRGALLDNHLRSQNDAIGVVRDLELGKITR